MDGSCLGFIEMNTRKLYSFFRKCILRNHNQIFKVVVMSQVLEIATDLLDIIVIKILILYITIENYNY